MHHVIMYSGGVGSFAAACELSNKVSAEDITLLFTDTKTEDPDLYRFLHETATALGMLLVIDADGRNIWEIFRDEKYIGNSRIDPCSKILKRKRARKWIETHYPDPGSVCIYVGIDWTEIHRIPRIKSSWTPYKIEAPLIEAKYIDRQMTFDALGLVGIAPPRLYEMGFPHNNCGGFCVKTGQSQFKLLYEKLPETYEYHEQQEQQTIKHIGKNYGFIRKTTNGVLRYLTMREFRQEILEGSVVPSDEFGGCGCFTDADQQES